MTENSISPDATSCRAFIPGLLQTREYVRSLRDSPTAEAAKGPESDETFIAARLARRRRLSQEPPLSLRVVLYEAALRNFPGGTAMAERQLDELLRLADLPTVSLRVHPFGVGLHLGLDGSFNILSFATPGAMDVVYMEGAFTQRWIEGGDATAAYDVLFDQITEHSLSERESVAFLHQLRKEA